MLYICLIYRPTRFVVSSMSIFGNTVKYQVNAQEIKSSADGSDYLGKGSYGIVQRVYTKKFGVSAAKIIRLTGTVDRQKSVYEL